MKKSNKALFKGFILFFITVPLSFTIAAPVVESVAISGDKLIVTGHKFLDIDGLILSDPQTGFKKPFKVESATESEIIGTAVDDQKITVASLMNLIIDTAKGETIYPVSFSLQKDAVTNPTIKNGAITPDKFIGVTTADPPDQTVPTWSQATQSFIFTKASGGGGTSGVSQIVLGPGIAGAPNTASGSVPVSVDIGQTGDALKTKIPYFSSKNKIILDSTSSPSDALSGLSFKDGTLNFDIFNDNGLRIDSETAKDLLVLDVDGNLALKGPVTIGGFDVCLSNGNCIPSSGLTLVTATAPLVAAKTATGTTNISAGAVNTANNLVQLESTGRFPANIPGVVRGPGSAARSATQGNLAIFSDTSGEKLGDGGIGLQNIVSMSATPTSANKIVISTGTNKVLGTTSYTIPTTTGVTGQVLGVTATGTTNWVNVSGVTSFNTRTGAVIPQAGDYTAGQVTNLPFGIITATTVQQAIDQLADLDSQKLPKAGGTMTGTITTSTQNAIKIGPFATGTGEVQFLETAANGTSYVGFKSPASLGTNTVWTLPAADGSSGTVLSTNGSKQLAWTSLGAAGVGNVVGPNSSTSTNLATFNGTTGKLIQDSGISSNNLVTMSGSGTAGNVIITGGGKIAQDSNIPLSNLPIMQNPATASNTIILSAGNSKDLKSTPYTIPPNIGSATFALKSDGTNVQWAPDESGTGDVVGPAVSTDTSIPTFSGTTGKLLQNTLFKINGLQINGPNVAIGENSEYGPSVACLSHINFKDNWAAPGFCQDSLGGAHMKGEVQLDFSIAGNSRFYIDPTTTTNKQNFVNNGFFKVGSKTFFVNSTLNTVGIGTLTPTQAFQIDSTLSGFLPPRMTTEQKNFIAFPPPGLIVYDTDTNSLNVRNASEWVSLASGTGDVVGPATATLNSVARYESGKIIKESGITIDDANNISGINQINGIVISNLITGSGLVGNLPIFGLLPSELDDSGIAIINIPTMASNATAAFHPILSGGANKSQIAAPYTFPNTVCLAGEVLKWNATGFTCQSDFGGSGDVIGPATSTLNNLATYSDATGKIIKDSGINSGNLPTMAAAATAANKIIISAGANKQLSTTLYPIPAAIGASGTVLKSDGTNATWQSDNSGSGDVLGPASSTASNLASFNNTTGKLIQDSGVSSTNLMTMTSPAAGAGNILTSQGANKIAIDSDIIIDGSSNVTGMGTLNGRTIANFVDGPASATSTNLAAFNGTTGKLIADSGVGAANIVTKDNNFSAANRLALSAGNNKKLSETGYTIPQAACSNGEVLKFTGGNLGCAPDTAGTGDVAGPATATLNSVARYESGKIIKESGIIIDDANNISGINQINGIVVNNIVSGSGLVGNIPTFGLLPSELEDSGIALINIPTMATNATAQFHPILSGGNNKSQIAAPYTLPNTACLPGEVLKWNATGFTCQADFGGSGDVAGPATSVLNTLAQFSDTTGKTIKGTAWTVPSSIGLPGQYLQVVGGQDLGWTSLPSSLVNVGLAPVVADNLPKFGSTTGTQIIDSGIATANVPTMLAAAASSNTVILSGGADKTLKSTSYTIPSTIGSPNFVLKSDGTNATWQADEAGTGDVAGPATATLNSVARYESGKVIKESGIIIDDANNISGIGQLNGIAVNNLLTGSGLVGNLPIFGLLPSELDDSGIALINIPTMASNATAAFHPILSGGANKSQIAAPYTFPNTVCLAGEVLKWNATGFTCQSDVSGTGDVAGPATATLNSIARYASGKVIKESGIIIDDANNISGVAQLNSKVANNLVTGTGIGVGRNLPIYVGMSPTEIVDSGISLDNIPNMASNATAQFQPILSGGSNKSQTAAPYTMPNTTCLPGEVLKWNTTGFTCQIDLGGSGLTEWVAGKDYKVGEIFNTGSDANWLFKVVQDHTSVDVPADFRAGKIMAIAPPIITTGVQAGGQVTLAGNSVTVQGGTGSIAKYGTSASALPLITIVEWTTQSITLPTTGIHSLFITNEGELVSNSGILSLSAQDDIISVGVVDMNLGAAFNRKTYPTNPVGQLRGLAFFFGALTKGLKYSGSGLQLSRTAHEVYYWGADSTNPYDPNSKEVPALSPMTFFEFTKNGAVFPATRKITLRNDVYDNNGTLTTMGLNKWGFVRIYSSPGADDYVMYSQDEYNNEGEAKNAAVSPEFVKPIDLELTKFSSWFVFNKGDTDLSDNPITVCEPFGCDKIGTQAGGGTVAGDVLGPASSLDNSLALFSGVNGKTIKSTSYTFPPDIGSATYVLKSDGTNATWQADNAGTGDVAGPATATLNSIARYESGKVIKNSGITIDDANNIFGINQINGIVVNNIISGSGLVGNLPIFGMLPSELEDSGIALISIPTMASNATAQFHPILSGGNNKSQIAAPYTLPSTSCLPGEVLKWNTTGFTCQADIGGSGSGLGDVTGPASATINSVPLFADSSGKVLKTTDYTIPNLVCPSGQVLKSDGINFTCQADINGLTEWVAGKEYKAGEIVNTGSDGNWLFKVVRDHTSAYVPSDFKAGNIMAIAPPIITTGLQDGGQATLAGNVATVQAGTGYIASYGASPSAWPLITIVEWPTQTITLPPSGIHTLFINQDGQLISIAGISGYSAQDDTISVGIVDMNLGRAYDRETYPTNPVGQLRGLAFFFGGMTRGLNYSGTGLQLSRTAYEMYWWGANSSDPFDPNSKDEPALSPVTFFEFTRAGPVLPADQKITLRNNVYDNNGTLTTMANNKWGFIRIFSSPGVDDYVMYSQAEYANENEAKNAAVSPSFVKPLDLELTKFSSWFVFEKGDLDFSNNPITVCEPFGCDKIGTQAGGGVGGDVLGPASSSVNSLAQFSGTNGKTLRSTPYTFPLAPCSLGQILKSDGKDFICAADGIGASAATLFLPSDKKLKKEIKNLPEGYIERLMDLRPVSFVWRDTLNPDMGLIAQDVSKIFPDLVENSDEGLGINYSKLVVPIVKAFQEKVQKDEQTIKMLLDRIERLEKIIEAKK